MSTCSRLDLQRKEKEKLTPVYVNGVNVSSLSKHGGPCCDMTFMPPWEVGSLGSFVVPFV